MYAKKSLGQNFLVDLNIVKKIVNLIEIRNKNVVEIGPGKGALTDLILQKLLRVKQIEDNKGKTLVSEGIDANYFDMVNYAIFALIHLELE